MFRPARRRLPWVVLLAAWGLLAWAWAFGPAALPYDPWGTAEPPLRGVSVYADRWRRWTVLHPADRAGWEALHGHWHDSRRSAEAPSAASVRDPLPGVTVKTAPAAAWGPVREAAVDLLWPGGWLLVWTGLLLAWGVRRRVAGRNVPPVA